LSINDDEVKEAKMTSSGDFSGEQVTDHVASQVALRSMYALCCSLAVRLVQTHSSAPRARAFAPVRRKGLDQRRLSRVLYFIDANLEGDLTIARLAGIACLSRFHFARAFKAATGHSPHQYVRAQRLVHAKALLLKDERPLIDISLALGFSGQANFTRAFRDLAGHTPGEYRRQFRFK
jgi:AraC family transcriptional regulator